MLCIIRNYLQRVHMKHPRMIVYLFLGLFAMSHILGLSFLVLEHTQETSLILDTPQPVDGGWSVLYILVGVLIATVILLILAKFNQRNLWKGWFTVATMLGLLYGLQTFLPDGIALIAAVLIALARLYFTHPWVHNTTEVIMYGGIGLALTPLFTPLTSILLLFIMSVYDIYAVRKSKHMITLATFTRKAESFPGLSLNYTNVSPPKKQSLSPEEELEQGLRDLKQTKPARKSGVLGGGDVLFPLLIANTVFLSLQQSFTVQASFMGGLGVTASAMVGLWYLFTNAEDTYYPALPYIFIPVLLYVSTLFASLNI